jgi:hypothetical protein
MYQPVLEPVTIGGNSTDGPAIRNALLEDLQVPVKSAMDLDYSTLFLQLGRENGYTLLYLGENYGYRVQPTHEAGAAFLRTWAERKGFAWS